jgi:predicted Zn-dependent protease
LKNRICLLFVAAWLLLLGGCANVTTQTTVKNALPNAVRQEVIPQETPTQGLPAKVVPTPEATRGPSGEAIIAEPVPKPVVSGNQAVVALLDRARLDTGAGRREAAGASLERALRIEPRNAWLWHELAQLRLAQGQYAQAISLAQKSSSFAGRERGLRALNWRVIGNARVAQGDAAGAEQALKLAAELEQ